MKTKCCNRKIRSVGLRALVAVWIGILGAGVVVTGHPQDGNGPELRSFLDLMRHEEDELEFQIKQNEITRKEYTRSKNRIAIHRQTVLNLVKETGQDYVPEMHVVATAEVDQLIEDGTAALKGIKQGDVIKEKWRYLGSAQRGEVFYIFERLPRK
ncbi:MAG: hypothetical protein AABO41_23030 [Acidobacteriota bacterium]